MTRVWLLVVHSWCSPSKYRWWLFPRHCQISGSDLRPKLHCMLKALKWKSKCLLGFYSNSCVLRLVNYTLISTKIQLKNICCILWMKGCCICLRRWSMSMPFVSFANLIQIHIACLHILLPNLDVFFFGGYFLWSRLCSSNSATQLWTSNKTIPKYKQESPRTQVAYNALSRSFCNFLDALQKRVLEHFNSEEWWETIFTSLRYSGSSMWAKNCQWWTLLHFILSSIAQN